MNIVTSADSGFFHCLQKLAESVRKHYDKQIILYDIGLTDEEKRSVDAQIVPIQVQVDFSHHAVFRKKSSSKQQSIIKATHKPFCVKHYFENNPEPMILVDADCFFKERVLETGFDVGVTLRREKRINLTSPWTGILNTGVVFFNTYAKRLIDAWIEGCQRENTTDQRELSEILSETIDWKHYNKVYDWHGLNIKVFNAEEYNDVLLKNGKIFHFKGHRHRKDIFETLMGLMDQDVDLYRVFKDLTQKPKKSAIRKLINRLFRKNS